MKLSPVMGTITILIGAIGLAGAQPPEKKNPFLPPPLPQPPRMTPVSPAVSLLYRFGDKALQSELKLTAAQIETLLAFRQMLWDEAYVTEPKESAAKEDEHNKAIAAAMKGALSADQFRRAEQLGLQQTWAGRSLATRGKYAEPTPDGIADLWRAPIELLAKQPEVAEALKLSEEQKETVAAKPQGPTAHPRLLLSSEQKDAAARILGPLVKARWRSDHDSRSDTYSRYYFSPPPRLALIAPGQRGIASISAGSDIIQELGVIEEQRNALAKVTDKWGEFNKSRPYELSGAEIKKRCETLLTLTDQAITDTLKPEQLVRLSQLVLRYEKDPAWGNRFTPPLIITLKIELGITADQDRAIAAVEAKHLAAVSEAAAGNRGYAAAHRGVRAANQDRDKALDAVLTADQKKKLDSLVGKQLPSRVRPDFGPTYGLVSRIPESEFGHYTRELSLLVSNKSIQAELKLAPDQVEKSKAASREMTRLKLNRPPGNGKKQDPDQLQAKTDYIQKALTGILDNKQAVRFRQIMIQEREFPTGRSTFSRPTTNRGVTYPGVAEEIKLTAEQKKRLLAGEHPADVLTVEQGRKMEKLIGARYVGDYELSSRPGSPRNPPRDRFDGGDRARWEFMGHLPLDALKLQKELLATLVEDIARYPHRPAEVGRLGANDRPFGGGFGRQPAAIPPSVPIQMRLPLLSRKYTPETVLRIDQLRFQSMAAVNLRDALTQPDTEKQLSLTPAQLTYFADMEVEAGNIVMLVRNTNVPIEARDKMLRKVRDQLDEQYLSVLSPEQLAAWKKLTGEKWDGFAKQLMIQPVQRNGR